MRYDLGSSIFGFRIVGSSIGDLGSRSPIEMFVRHWQAYYMRGAGVVQYGRPGRHCSVLAAASQPCLEMEADAIGRGPGGKRGSTLVDRLSAGEAASEGNSRKKRTTPFSE